MLDTEFKVMVISILNFGKEQGKSVRTLKRTRKCNKKTIRAEEYSTRNKKYTRGN